MSTRTGPAVKKLVEHLQEDLADVIERLQGARDLLGALEEDARGINGTSSVLKAKGATLDQMISDLREEAEDVSKKLLGSKTPEIRQTVDSDHASAVKAARVGP